MTTLRILIRLPHDRAQPGSLNLVDIEPTVLFSCDCLGKADGQRALAEGNRQRDPLKPYGDTPTGEYAAARVRTHEPPHPRMGPLSIALIGIAGDAVRAKQDRVGLAIHAGRGDGHLIPTYGCIRLRDRDLADLAAVMAGRAAEIFIAEIPQGA